MLDEINGPDIDGDIIASIEFCLNPNRRRYMLTYLVAPIVGEINRDLHVLTCIKTRVLWLLDSEASGIRNKLNRNLCVDEVESISGLSANHFKYPTCVKACATTDCETGAITISRGALLFLDLKDSVISD